MIFQNVKEKKGDYYQNGASKKKKLKKKKKVNFGLKLKIKW